ncbi:recombinase family protein [Salipaludibacillus sp. HK11]|uniref:recombinase family protein n=1 Tax=Salipaludibacillus sp. HK11 TaxID=3394320 RepID=UPI0039FC1CBF
MRCAIYIRVSTKLQENKFSLGAQQSELHTHADQMGWKVIGEFKDVESGGKLNKKGLNSLLDLVEDDRIDVVLCIDQDRLSRLDTVAWEYLKSTLRDNKVKIAEPGSITDLADEDQEFISDIKNLIARREKKSTVKRMMRGKRQRMREGKPWGKAPIGYKYHKETSSFTIDEEWSWVIPTIDRLYIEEELGMKTIGDRLNEISRTPNGNLWNETLVYRRLVSKAFHGIMEKKFANGEVIRIENMYPPLRTKETYDAIQRQRNLRSTQFKCTSRKRNDQYIFRRVRFTCGHCGRKISLNQNGTVKAPLYYLRHGRKKSVSDESVCHITINTIRFEDNFTKALSDILSNPNLASQYIDIDKDDDDINDLRTSVKQREKSIKKIEEKKDRLLDLYLDGSFSKSQLDEKQKSFDFELDALKKIQNADLNKMDMLKNKEWNYEMVYEYLEVMEDFENEFPSLEQAKMVGTLFPEAILYEEKIIFQAPSDEIPIELEIPIDEDPYKWHHSKTNDYKEKYWGKS